MACNNYILDTSAIDKELKKIKDKTTKDSIKNKLMKIKDEPFSRHCAMLCICPVRSVGSLSRTCFRDLRLISDVQVFILHRLPRGQRTHGERVSAQIDATEGYGQ